MHTASRWQSWRQKSPSGCFLVSSLKHLGVTSSRLSHLPEVTQLPQLWLGAAPCLVGELSAKRRSKLSAISAVCTKPQLGETFPARCFLSCPGASILGDVGLHGGRCWVVNRGTCHSAPSARISPDVSGAGEGSRQPLSGKPIVGGIIQ